MNWKSNGLALVFGMLIMLVIFGDAVYIHQPEGLQQVGNLDTLFGNSFWPLMDVLIPIASLAVFLLYGKARGVIKLNVQTVALLVIFLISLMSMIIDDFALVLGHAFTLSDTYWAVARWLYPLIAASTFLGFGRVCAGPTLETERSKSLRRSNFLDSGAEQADPQPASRVARQQEGP